MWKRRRCGAIIVAVKVTRVGKCKSIDSVSDVALNMCPKTKNRKQVKSTRDEKVGESTDDGDEANPIFQDN